MRLFLFIFVAIAAGSCDKLDRTYLPPPGSKFAGGSPGAILGPLDTPYLTPNAPSFGQDPQSGLVFEQGLRQDVPSGDIENIPNQNLGNPLQQGIPQNSIPQLPYYPVTQSPINHLQNIFNVPSTTTSYAFTQTTTHPPILRDYESSTYPTFGFSGQEFNPQNFLPQQPFLNNQYLPGQENIQNGYIHNEQRPLPQNQKPGYIHKPQNNVIINPDQQSQITDPQFDQPINRHQRPLSSTGPIAGDTISPSAHSQFSGSSSPFSHHNGDYQSSVPSNNFNGESPTSLPDVTVPNLQTQNRINGNIPSQKPSNSFHPQSQSQREIQNDVNKTPFHYNQNSPNINSENGPTSKDIDHTVNRGQQRLQHDNIPFEDFPHKPAGSIVATSTASSITPELYSHSNPSLTENHKINMEVINRSERVQAEGDRNAVIFNYENTITPDGDFTYSFDTSNGIHADESGTSKDGVKAHGAFSYIGDDGKNYSIVYIADENGYQPRGDHLPTPPPIPEAILKVIEQANKEKEAGVFHDGSYDEEKYGYKNYEKPGNQYRAQQTHGDLQGMEPKTSLKQENRFRDVPVENYDHKMNIDTFENNKPTVDNYAGKDGSGNYNRNPSKDHSGDINKKKQIENESRQPTNKFDKPHQYKINENGQIIPTNNQESKTEFSNHGPAGIVNSESVNRDHEVDSRNEKPTNRPSSNKNDELRPTQDFYDETGKLSQDKGEPIKQTQKEFRNGQVNNNRQPSTSYNGFENQYLPEEGDLDLNQKTDKDEQAKLGTIGNKRISNDNDFKAQHKNTQPSEKPVRPSLIIDGEYENTSNGDTGNDYLDNENLNTDRKDNFNGNQAYSTQKQTFEKAREETGYEYFPPQQPFNQESDGLNRVSFYSNQQRNQNKNLRPFMTPNVYNKEGSLDDIPQINGQHPGKKYYNRHQIVSGPSKTSPHLQQNVNLPKTNPENYEKQPPKSYEKDITSGPRYEPSIYSTTENNRRPIYNQRVPSTPGQSYTNNQLVSSTTPIRNQKPIYGSTESQPIQKNQVYNRGPYSTVKPTEINSSLTSDYVTERNSGSKSRPISPSNYNKQPEAHSRINEAANPIQQKTGSIGNLPSTTYRPNYTINEYSTTNSPYDDSTNKYSADKLRSPGQGATDYPNNEGIDHSNTKPVQIIPYQQGPSDIHRPTTSQGQYYPTTEQRIFPITEEKNNHQRGQTPANNFGRQPNVERPQINLGPFQGPRQNLRSGEDFSGPNHPQYFDEKTGYHY